MEKLKAAVAVEPSPRPRVAPARDDWSVVDARALYGIDRWGHGYYSVDEDGEVCADLEPQEGGPIVRTSIAGLMRDLKKTHPDLALPLLFRFSDVLHSRIEELNLSFHRAIAEHNTRDATAESIQSRSTSSTR